MKTFKDLEFKKHPVPSHFNTQAVMNFDNDYGISVINGKGAYCGLNTFEVAVLYKDALTYNTDITDDVIGYQNESDIDVIMERIQKLK